MLHRGGGVDGATELSACRMSAEERQHDEAHQGTRQLDQRPGVRFGESLVEHTERSADDGLRGQRRRVAPRGSTFVIQHPGEAIEHLGASSQHRWPRLRGMHDAIPCERRLLIEELEQRQQPRPHPIQPALLGLEGRARALGGKRQHLLERREQTGFAALKMILDRPA